MMLLMMLNGLVLGLTMVISMIRTSSRDVETNVPTLEQLALGPINLLKHFGFHCTPRRLSCKTDTESSITSFQY